MSERERWTVYPLLFLAIGLAMRAVLVPPAAIVCQEIVVQDEDGTVVLHLGRIAGGGGRLEINDRDGNALMAIGSLPAQAAPEKKNGEGAPATPAADTAPRAAIEFSGPDGEVVRRLTIERDDGR